MDADESNIMVAPKRLDEARRFGRRACGREQYDAVMHISVFSISGI